METGAGWDVDRIMEEMSFRQLRSWVDYFRLQSEQMEEARGEQGEKVNVTPEHADMHMRIWARTINWKGAAKA